MSKVVIAGDASGTGTFTISAPNGNTDRTLVLPDEAGTVLTSASPTVLPKGVPAFSAYNSVNQTVSAQTSTKAVFNSTEFNVGIGWDTVNNWFKPTVAGYYQVNWQVANGTANYYMISYLRKNGNNYSSGTRIDAASSFLSNGSATVYLNGSTDYLEVYGYTSGTVFQSPNVSTDLNTRFSGFLVGAD